MSRRHRRWAEVIFDAEFYDYHATYDDPRTQLHIPADIPAATAERLREIAVEAYKAIDCAGLARVDFFRRLLASCCSTR